MKKLKPLFVILTTALILFSAVCFLYPAISNAINEQYNESRIDDYNNNVDSFSQEDLDGYFSVAEKYNDALATDVSTDDSKLSILSHYDEILDLDDGVMGYVEIPSINVRLPIYHGESEDVLTKTLTPAFPRTAAIRRRSSLTISTNWKTVTKSIFTFLTGR